MGRWTGETDAQGKLKLEPRSTPPPDTIYAHVLLRAYTDYLLVLPEVGLDYSVQSGPLITFAVTPERQARLPQYYCSREVEVTLVES